MEQVTNKLNVEERMETFRQRCRERGLRLTPQRSEIYRTLVNMKTHPTAEEVYKAVRRHFRNISFDTVNRTLITLSEIGAAFIVEGTGQPRRFDGGLEDHQHFRCVSCGRIIDFHHEPFDRIDVPSELEQGCEILRKTVYFEGLCSGCARLNNHAAQRPV